MGSTGRFAVGYEGAMGLEKITIRDVAMAAGVSTATVSRSLNLPEQVTPKLRAQVEEAAARLGYLAHGPARALASRRSGTVAAVVPTLDNPVFATCIDALESRLDAHGLVLLVARTGYDPEREARGLRALLERGVDGVMLVGVSHSPEVWRLLRTARDVPAVLTWCEGSGAALPCIGFDNVAAARRVVEHLIGLGHRRIAMIAGITRGNDRAAARVEGVRQGLADAGLPWPASRRTERAYSVADGMSAVQSLMMLRPRPTAVVCGNDHLAFGALAGARALGLRVPGDLSVTGFDDLDFAAHATPALTTVRVPAAEMGLAAADHLAAQAAGQTPPPLAGLKAPLVLRESTGRRSEQ